MGPLWYCSAARRCCGWCRGGMPSSPSCCDSPTTSLQSSLKNTARCVARSIIPSVGVVLKRPKRRLHVGWRGCRCHFFLDESTTRPQKGNANGCATRLQGTPLIRTLHARSELADITLLDAHFGLYVLQKCRVVRQSNRLFSGGCARRAGSHCPPSCSKPSL
jgi:hypothetical protein